MAACDNGLKPCLTVNLLGPGAAGKRESVALFSRKLGRELYELDLKTLHVLGVRPSDAVPLLERECRLLWALLYIDVTEHVAENDPGRPLADLIVEQLNSPLVIASAEPWRTRRPVQLLTMPRLPVVEQTAMWTAALGDSGALPLDELDSLVQQFDLERDRIEQAKCAALAAGAAGCTVGEKVWAACREQSRSNLEGLAQRIEPCFNWDDIVLPETARLQLHDIASQVGHRALVYEKWGFGARLSRGRGISALFSGPPGTGKTMAADVLANELRLDLYRIDLSQVVSKYIGETEKNLRRVFDAAEQSGAVLFFDEADALFGKRSEVKDSHDRYANIEVSYLLQRMEDYRGLAILATNRKSLLDDAFLRRLRFHVEFPFPRSDDRRAIWVKSFPAESRHRLASGDLDFLSRLEIAGGNIRNVVLNAAFLAAAEPPERAVTLRHVLRATKREYAKMGKLILESEFGPYYGQVSGMP